MTWLEKEYSAQSLSGWCFVMDVLAQGLTEVLDWVSAGISGSVYSRPDKYYIINSSGVQNFNVIFYFPPRPQNVM